MSPGLVGLIGLALAPVVRGWVLFPADALQGADVELKSIEELLDHGNIDGRPPLFRWSANLDLRKEAGLGGGITYAFDPQLCELMLPLFSEGKDLIRFYEFVTCDVLKDVVVSAFRTWSANNRNIYFTDVTAICDERDLWVETGRARCTSSTCRYCPLAEVVVTLFESTPEDHTGARVQPEAVASKPLGTNLETSAGGSFEFVNLEFGTNLCWYVDATFCSFFHGLEQDGMPVVAIVSIVLSLCFLVSAAITLYGLWKLLRIFLYTMLSTWDTDQDGIIEMWEIKGAGRAVLTSLRNACK
jgi:hypothetical protein